MAATKKHTPKKAKASVKKSAVKAAASSNRAPRKQYAAADAAAVGRETFTLVLASLFTILSVLFAIISYWRYHL